MSEFDQATLLVHENGCVMGATLGTKQREELRAHASKPHVGSCSNCAGVIPRLLDTLDAMESALIASPWIPCDQRLPEAGVDVLVAWREGGTVKAFVSRHGGWHNTERGQLIHPHFWMPIPPLLTPDDAKENR